MPVTPADFIVLPCDESLTLAGIEYARKSLYDTYNRMALGLIPRLRKIVAGVAVELAFVRYLQREVVPFDRLGSTHFTRRDLYDLGLATRRVDLKTSFISDRRKIRDLGRDPGWLLEAAALVPADQLASDSMGEGDVYLFGFLAGLETDDATTLRRALAAGQPAYLLRTFDDSDWARSQPWRSLGRLALKSKAAAPVEIEIAGQGRNLEPIVERLNLMPKVRAVVESDFYSVLYLHTPALPDAVIGVHSPALRDTRLIWPDGWSNLWVYGLRIYLAGYLTKNELRRKSERLRPGSEVKQYAVTDTDNWAVPVKDLRPVAELIEAARKVLQ